MQKQRACWLIICLLLASVAQASAAESREVYLTEPAFGARGLVLGGLAAGGADLSSVYWNAADLPFLGEGWGLTYGQNNKFGLGDWKEQQLGFVLNKTGPLRVGGFYIQDGVSLEEQKQGQLVGNPWQTTQLGFSLGVRLNANLAIGGSIKQIGIGTSFDNENLREKVLLADVACVLRRGRWQLGLVMKNRKLIGKMDTTPELHTGLAWNSGDIRAQIQLVSYCPPETGERTLSVGGGLEFVFRPGLILRVGRSQMRFAEPSSLVAGLGLKVGSLGFDYAYRIHSIGSTHFLSTSWSL